MAGKIHIQELDKIVIFVTLLLMIYVFRPKRQRTTRTLNQNQRFNKPPSGLGILLAKCIILTIMFVAVNTLNAQKKAAEEIEKERKKRKKDYISDWFRFIELTNKYLKQKLN